nr:hypothetical protein [Tanacetum cinerariifolium]
MSAATNSTTPPPLHLATTTTPQQPPSLPPHYHHPPNRRRHVTAATNSTTKPHHLLLVTISEPPPPPPRPSFNHLKGVFGFTYDSTNGPNKGVWLWVKLSMKGCLVQQLRAFGSLFYIDKGAFGTAAHLGRLVHC